MKLLIDVKIIYVNMIDEIILVNIVILKRILGN